jgi:hypothetical protein
MHIGMIDLRYLRLVNFWKSDLFEYRKHRVTMNRNKLSALLAGVLSLSLVMTTTAPIATAQDLSGTITVLSHRTDLDKDGTLARYSEEFKKLHPNVTVNWETITDYAGEVATRLNTTDYGEC